MNKLTIVAPALVAVALVGGVFLSTQVSAQETTTQNSSIVTRIAQKFGLNQTDVQAFFDEEHEARHAEMRVENEKRLTQLVTDGKITADQKQLILDKHAEIEQKRESTRNSRQGKTPEEMKTLMEAEHTALKSWAEENDIDLQYLIGFGKKIRGGHGKKDVMFFTEKR